MLKNDFLAMLTVYLRDKMLNSAEDAWLKMLHQPTKLAPASDSSVTMQYNIMQPFEIVLKSTVFSNIPTSLMPPKGLFIEQFSLIQSQGSLPKPHTILRQEYPSFELNAILTIQTKWINEVLSSYGGDQMNIDILTSKSVKNLSYSDYSIINGIVKLKGRVYIGKSSDLRLKAIQNLHDFVHDFVVGDRSEIANIVERCDISKQDDITTYVGLLASFCDFSMEV